MGIDSFKTEQSRKYNSSSGRTINSVSGAVHCAKKIKVKVTKNKLEEADSVDDKLKAILEWPSSKEWNSNKEGITTTWHGDLKQNTGLPALQIYLRAGAHPGLMRGRKNIDYELKIISDLYLAATIFGEDFGAEEFNSHPLLSTHRQIKRSLGLTLNEAKEQYNLEVNRYIDLTEDEIVKELKEEFEKGENITSSKVDSRIDKFSHKVIANKGKGSFIKGLKNIGLENRISYRQRVNSEAHSSSSSSNSIAKNQLDKFEIDEESDAYIYLLECKDSDGGIRYYVGSIDTGRSIHKRLSEHIEHGGDFSPIIKKDGQPRRIYKYDFSWKIGIEDVYELYYSDVSDKDITLKQLVDGKEKIKYVETVRNVDYPVHGGL